MYVLCSPAYEICVLENTIREMTHMIVQIVSRIVDVEYRICSIFQIYNMNAICEMTHMIVQIVSHIVDLEYRICSIFQIYNMNTICEMTHMNMQIVYNMRANKIYVR